MGFHVNLYECISLFLPSQPRPTKTLGSKDFPDVRHTFLQEADVCEGCPLTIDWPLTKTVLSFTSE